MNDNTNINVETNNTNDVSTISNDINVGNNGGNNKKFIIGVIVAFLIAGVVISLVLLFSKNTDDDSSDTNNIVNKESINDFIDNITLVGQTAMTKYLDDENLNKESCYEISDLDDDLDLNTNGYKGYVRFDKEGNRYLSITNGNYSFEGDYNEISKDNVTTNKIENITCESSVTKNDLAKLNKLSMKDVRQDSFKDTCNSEEFKLLDKITKSTVVYHQGGNFNIQIENGNVKIYDDETTDTVILEVKDAKDVYLYNPDNQVSWFIFIKTDTKIYYISSDYDNYRKPMTLDSSMYDLPYSGFGHSTTDGAVVNFWVSDKNGNIHSIEDLDVVVKPNSGFYSYLDKDFYITCDKTIKEGKKAKLVIDNSGPVTNSFVAFVDNNDILYFIDYDDSKVKYNKVSNSKVVEIYYSELWEDYEGRDIYALLEDGQIITIDDGYGLLY